MEHMNQKDIIANGLTDAIMGTKLVLRSGIWFGFGWHKAYMAEQDKAFEAELRASFLAAGKAKSEASRRVKAAREVGKVFAEKFGAHLASDWASVGDFIQACYMAMCADGVTSEAKMLDWAMHGDAEHTAKAEERKRAEKAEAEAKAKADRATMVAEAGAAPIMDIGATPQPLAKAPVAEVAEVAEVGSNLEHLTDAELAALAEAVVAEKARRAEAAMRVAAE